MRVTFVLPGYPWHPHGGVRIVYQYANALARRGHKVSVVHAYEVKQTPIPIPGSLRSLRARWRKVLAWKRSKFPPPVHWQTIDSRVRMLFLQGEPTGGNIPDGDAVFATRWETAEYVAGYPARKGAKFYLIQHHETMMGPPERVDATWQLPLHKVVISHWLYELGQSMGAVNLRHIPNAIDHDVFRVLTPPEQRPPGIVTLYSSVEWKGVADALAVLRRVHERYPHLRVTMYGGAARAPEIDSWIAYYQDPPQEVLVRDIYNAHTIYLGASWTEGWALPPAEAMACGCLFVGTDIGGFRDYAEHERTALLSPPRDVESLYANVCRALEDPGLARRLQQAGSTAIREFTWERSGSALERYIAEVVERPMTDRLVA